MPAWVTVGQTVIEFVCDDLLALLVQLVLLLIDQVLHSHLVIMGDHLILVFTRFARRHRHQKILHTFKPAHGDGPKKSQAR